MKKVIKISLIVIVVLIAAVAVITVIETIKTNAERSERIAGTELHVGDDAPDFTVPLLTGGEFTLSEHIGTPIFLNFWATWCGPCVAEMPDIRELSEKYKDSMIFIGVNSGENGQKVQDFIDKWGYDYTIGLNESGDLINNTYPSVGIPYTVIIDSNGVITEIFTGGGKDMSEPFEAAIISALGE